MYSPQPCCSYVVCHKSKMFLNPWTTYTNSQLQLRLSWRIEKTSGWELIETVSITQELSMDVSSVADSNRFSASPRIADEVKMVHALLTTAVLLKWLLSASCNSRNTGKINKNYKGLSCLSINHLVIKYLLSLHYVPGIVVGTGDIDVNKVH